MIDYKITINKRFSYTFVIFDSFSKILWCIPLKITYNQTITNEFSSFLTPSKRKPLKIESDRGTEFYNSIFQKFLKSKKVHHFSRFTDKGPSTVERVIRAMRNLLKEPVFEKGNAIWFLELPSVIRKYINTIHHRKKTTPIEASKTINEKKSIPILKTKEKFENQKLN